MWPRRKPDTRLDDELRYHFEQLVCDFMAEGADPAEARRRARLELGGFEQIKEEVRDVDGRRLEYLWKDLQYAVRTHRRSPGFLLVCVLTLALGIGASTAIFSVVEAVLLRALPYPNPQQIARVWEAAPGGHRMNLSDPNFDDFQSQNSTFSALAVYSQWLSTVAAGGNPARFHVSMVSRDFFKALGVQPSYGRPFTSAEQVLHGAPAAIISYGYWQRSLGGNRDLANCMLRVDGRVYPVVGVMPQGFDYPAGSAVWIARELQPELPSRTAHNWQCLGRIRDGVTIDQAGANLNAIAYRIRAQFGKKVDLGSAAVAPLADAMVGNVKTALRMLLATVALLLLVACANVAGLLVARTSARGKELAVRAALGASRARLVQLFLVESFLLCLIGGGLGVLLAAWAVRLLPAILPSNLPRQEGIAVNLPVLLFALAAIVLVALSLGLFSAWRAGKGDLGGSLSAGTRTMGGAVNTQRLRGFVVIGEVAATLMILVFAGLLGRSFLRLTSTSPGFSPDHLLTMDVALPSAPDDEDQKLARARQVHLLEDILTRLRAIPGVDKVGLAGALPVAAGDDLPDGNFLLLRGLKAPTTEQEWDQISQTPARVGHALYAVADEEYFRALGIPMIQGRAFGPGDNANSPHVAVISQTLARQRWPNEDPIGQVVDFANMDGVVNPLTIVGIAGDVRATGLSQPPSSVIYVNYRQRGARPGAVILMRSNKPMSEIAPVARDILRDLAPDAPVKFSTFTAEMGGWLADRRFLLVLAGVFALAALALAAVGIYGVVTFSVTRRTQEIGLRIALGARRADVLRLIIGEGARLAALGLLIGFVASFAITRLLSSLLYGVSASDPITFGVVALVLALVAILASYLPARRAMLLNPNAALRYE
jgi:predicted permease